MFLNKAMDLCRKERWKFIIFGSLGGRFCRPQYAKVSAQMLQTFLGVKLASTKKLHLKSVQTYTKQFYLLNF